MFVLDCVVVAFESFNDAKSLSGEELSSLEGCDDLFVFNASGTLTLSFALGSDAVMSCKGSFALGSASTVVFCCEDVSTVCFVSSLFGCCCASNDDVTDSFCFG